MMLDKKLAKHNKLQEGSENAVRSRNNHKCTRRNIQEIPKSQAKKNKEFKQRFKEFLDNIYSPKSE